MEWTKMPLCVRGCYAGQNAPQYEPGSAFLSVSVAYVASIQESGTGARSI